MSVVFIIGLGNPGELYVSTRHNIGFWAVDYLAKNLSLSFQMEKSFLWSSYQKKETRVYLIKPLTFMNQSGRVVEYLSRWHQKARYLIICDTVDLALGQFRYKSGWSHSAHNGLRSCTPYLKKLLPYYYEDELSDAQIWKKLYTRLYIGIGPRPSTQTLGDFVLEPFWPQEKKYILNQFNTLPHLVSSFMSSQ